MNKHLIDYQTLCGALDEISNYADILFGQVQTNMPDDAPPELVEGILFYVQQASVRLAEFKHMVYRASGYSLEMSPETHAMQQKMNTLAAKLARELDDRTSAFAANPTDDGEGDALAHAAAALVQAGASGVHYIAHLSTAIQRLEGRKPVSLASLASKTLQ